MQIVNTDITKVLPYVRNPRVNTDAVKKVAASIREFGFRQPIVVDKQNVIIAGHTRYEAAKRLKLKTVPVHVAENLNAEQVKAYRIADNKVAEFSTWAEDLLTLELRDLDAGGFDLSLTGFSSEDLEALLSGLKDEPIKEEIAPLPTTFTVTCTCEDEADQQAVYKILLARGYKCKISGLN
ncbi:MAG: ParB N-terminal domain-containing protein [Rhodospirillaceae bacterium]|nr:ParB N-terminal domain-containing protein [Rhodospirillaceae bacterium]